MAEIVSRHETRPYTNASGSTDYEILVTSAGTIYEGSILFFSAATGSVVTAFAGGDNASLTLAGVAAETVTWAAGVATKIRVWNWGGKFSFKKSSASLTSRGLPVQADVTADSATVKLTSSTSQTGIVGTVIDADTVNNLLRVDTRLAQVAFASMEQS